MHTQTLYYSDTYNLRHCAIVTHLEDNIVQLDSTIFHPQGGGQPSDIGTINGIPVVKVSNSDCQIKHILEIIPDFKVGDQVDLHVDELSRRLFSRLHSAGHLIAHVTEKYFPELKAVQGHHFPKEAHVEFIYNAMPDLKIFESQLIRALQEAISNDEPVISTFDDNGGRNIKLGSFTATPCGGTHVRSTSEIRGILIRSIKNKNARLRVGYDVV